MSSIWWISGEVGSRDGCFIWSAALCTHLSPRYTKLHTATRLIRKHSNPEICNVLIIAMTASAIQGDREKCLESGMNNYLAKPVRAQTLKALLDSYLNKEDNGKDIPGIQAEAKRLVQEALSEADIGGETKSRPPSIRMNTTQRIPLEGLNGDKEVLPSS